MKPQDLKLAWVMLASVTMIAAGGCRNTAHGVVRDTERNTEKVGHGIEHVGHKIGAGVATTGEKIQESTR